MVLSLDVLFARYSTRTLREDQSRQSADAFLADARKFRSSPPGIAVRKNGVASLAYDPVVHAESPHGLPDQVRQ
jgi:hypothetical protein